MTERAAPGEATSARNALVAFVLALAMLAVGELLLRAFATRLSGNVAHIEAFDALLHEADPSDGTRTVFIGNSLIGNAISVDDFRTAAAPNGGSVTPVKLVPDGTGIWDWRCIVSDRLPPARRAGDRIIIGFAWDQLSDQLALSNSKTFGLICPLSALADFRDERPFGIGDYLEAGFSKLSLTYTLRERLRNGVMSAIVPDYVRESQKLNNGAGPAGEPPAPADNHAPGAGPKQQQHAATYRSLAKLVADIRNLGYAPVFVAMPTIAGYSVDPALPTALNAHGATFVDMRSVPSLTAQHFVDPIHLGPDGARIFSTLLGRQLGTSDTDPVVAGHPPVAGTPAAR